MATDREKRAICEIMRHVVSPCIVELGARTGEDEPWLRAACREDPCYLMVEPDPWNAQKILDHPRGLDRNRRLILGAASSNDGKACFHLSDCLDDGSHTSGSLRQPTGHLDKYPKVHFGAVTVVPTWALDTIYNKEWLNKIDLLWVDIQGAEGDMILGARHALERTRYMFMEVETQEMYRGQALRDDLLKMLPGWNLLEDFGDNVLLQNTSMIEGRI